MTDDVSSWRSRMAFEPGGRTASGQWVGGWSRGDHERWPCFLERRLALDWMRDLLTRARMEYPTTTGVGRGVDGLSGSA